MRDIGGRRRTWLNGLRNEDSSIVGTMLKDRGRWDPDPAIGQLDAHNVENGEGSGVCWIMKW